MSRPAWIAIALLAGCHHRHHGPYMLSAVAPQAWTQVTLTVAGSEADDNKRDSCLEEANAAGIALVPNAPTRGTLYFLNHDDYLETSEAPNGRLAFASMGSNAECKLALATLTKLDQLVTVVKGDPANCKMTGMVEGSDSGFFHAGNYEAAVIEAQFKVHLAGGNRFVQDATRQQGQRVVVNGRGFSCAN